MWMAKPTYRAFEPTMLAIMANIPMTPISIPKIRPRAIPLIGPASAHTDLMDISVLHIEDCPNWAETGSRIRTALKDLGVSNTEVSFVELRTPEDASQVPFAGSPTILVDGTDLFPSDGRTTDLACRIYRAGAHFAGIPLQGDIEDALRRRL